MNENLKTALFAGAALLIAGVAWLAGPSHQRPTPTGEEARGKPMFGEALDDPLLVTRLEIMRFDDASRKCLPFEVAQVKGRRTAPAADPKQKSPPPAAGEIRWSIPSHSDYPADAKEHLAQAVNCLGGLTILGVAPGLGDEANELDQNTIRKLHNQYGVVDPDPESVKSSDDGVGMRVTMKDQEGKTLASLVIGKAVPDQSNLHYVRYTGKDPVYIVDIDTSKLSTKFEDWIEKNLLKLNTMDLKQVQIQDYSIDLTDEGAAVKNKGQMTLDYAGSGDAAWKLGEDLAFEKDKLVPRKMAADEELDSKKLDDLKFALDDLKIVDVNRKPGQVPPDLRIKTVKDLQVLQSLQERGFYAVQDPDGVKGHFQLVSNKGEIRLQMNDGVRYVLRFGEVTGESSQAADKTKDKAADKAKDKESDKEKAPGKGKTEGKDEGKDKKADKKDEKKDEPAPGMNRYLFLMTEFNPQAVAKPVFEALPKEEPEKKPADKKAEDKKADDKKADDQKSADKKTEDKKADDKKAEDKKAGDTQPAVKAPDAGKDQGNKDDSKKDEPKKAAAKDAGAKGDEGQKGAPKTEEPKKDEPKKDVAGKEEQKKEAAPSGEAKKDEPKIDGPKKDEVKKEEPKSEEGKKEEPKKEEPKKDEVKKEEPKTAEPKTTEPKTAEPKKDDIKKDEKKPDLKAERERIEKDNKRKQDEYDEKLAAGKKHVKELNDRFADWYYVISDDVYRKIHLGREQIVKKKEAPKDKDKDKGKDSAAHEHDHEHEHDSGTAEKPGPIGTLEKAKEDAPGSEKK